MTRYALLIEYDGYGYYGWQAQPNQITIQSTLELGLSKFANHKVATITAGRTDTGVHALNQVVHFDSLAKRTLQGWVRGVNSLLPPTIRIKEITLVTSEFNARYDALSRTYHYYLYLGNTKKALLAGKVGYYHKPLNLKPMQAALDYLIGRHDFSAFRASSCQAPTPYREMYKAYIEAQGNMLRFSLTANAFLHHMIRNIVGALVYVGSDKLSVEGFQQLVLKAKRTLAPPTFMADGLYLVDITYPDLLFNANKEQSVDHWLYYA